MVTNFKNSSKPEADSVLLKPSSVAGMLDIGVRTLWRWSSDGSFPPPDIRHNARIVRWKRSTVLAWIDAQSTATIENELATI